MFDKNYYIGKKQAIQQKDQKAQQKYADLSFMLGREFVDYQNRIAELQEELKEIEAEEAKSKEVIENPKKVK